MNMKSIALLFVFTIALKGFSQNPTFVLFDHTNAPFVNDSITWVKTDTSDVKWVGTRNGLYRFYNNTWTVYTTSNSTLPDNRIDKFEIAWNNTIWFLNHDKGFIKFDGTNFTVYNTSNLPALPTDSMAGIAIDSNDVFMWTNYHGIIKFNSIINSIYHIDTTNSYLQNISSLIFHNNHTLYGTCLNPQPGVVAFPQNKADSISSVNDFVIVNANTISINYCFLNIFNNCTYSKILSDKYHNRFEIYWTAGGPSATQRMRKYDANNNLIGDELHQHIPDKQRALNNHGEYSMYNSGSDGLCVNIFNPPFSTCYASSNSIIPHWNILNFDTDSHNNVWLSTPKGLVAYNEQGVITNITKLKESNLIKVFPNPCANIFNVESEKEIVEIKIYNQIGSLLISSQSITKSIDVSNLSNGIYFIEVKTKDNHLIRQKIVISM